MQIFDHFFDVIAHSEISADQPFIRIAKRCFPRPAAGPQLEEQRTPAEKWFIVMADLFGELFDKLGEELSFRPHPF